MRGIAVMSGETTYSPEELAEIRRALGEIMLREGASSHDDLRAKLIVKFDGRRDVVVPSAETIRKALKPKEPSAGPKVVRLIESCIPEWSLALAKPAAASPTARPSEAALRARPPFPPAIEAMFAAARAEGYSEEEELAARWNMPQFRGATTIELDQVPLAREMVGRAFQKVADDRAFFRRVKEGRAATELDHVPQIDATADRPAQRGRK